MLVLLVPVAGTALLRLLADLSASLEDQGNLAAAASCQVLTGRGVAVAYNLETAGGAIGTPAKGELVPADLVDSWAVLRRCRLGWLL